LGFRAEDENDIPPKNGITALKITNDFFTAIRISISEDFCDFSQ
jgi:hypothetical protein